MIFGKQSRIFPFDAFLDGLRAAAQGVLQVRKGKPHAFVCTGWLITDTLVVLPNYPDLSSTQGDFACLTYSEPPDVFDADLISTFAGPADSVPGLLRLRQALAQPALKWRDASVAVGDQVFLLHYPEGKRPLSLSIGSVITADGVGLHYDADTRPGSGGAPILDSHGELVGMHVAVRHAQSTGAPSNYGPSLHALLDSLRETPAWGEIARYHNVADITDARTALEKLTVLSAPAPTDDSLLRAAVCWDFDPKSFPQSDSERLRSLVSNPSAQRWVLQTSERQRLLRSAGSLDVLRQARGTEIIDDVRQQVLDRILKGPPYVLDDVAEAALPYWLQAVRWFAAVAPALPTPAAVNRTLEQRRVRSRLRDSAGPSFRGRADELATLGAWYAGKRPGPLVITGIGGVGKSALIAKFAVALPNSTLLLWLDFDRADLAPDDAFSVLRLLSEQVAVQVEGFTAPALDGLSWQETARKFGAALARTQRGAPAPLLVLDGFEVAQHVRRHAEIWQLLELILDKFPRLRVLVSGRAQVPNLTLHKRRARQLPLKGMARPDAEAWLREAGIQDEVVLGRVMDISHCVPLALVLVLRWLEAGGEIQQLPEALPNELVEGFLYRRILDRVIDPALKPVAWSALVLRRLMVEMIPEVLGDSIPEGFDAQEVFTRLAQEMALVEGSGGDPSSSLMPSLTSPGGSSVLQVRPEVRSATLRLLEMDNPSHVRTIDERAAAWYAKQNLDDVVNRAELVYHHLRLGDVAGADKAWRDDCAPLLLYAEDDMPAEARAARTWLHSHVSGVLVPAAKLEAWENEAAERIRAALGRELQRAVPKILAERAERSPASPLILYDAWMAWRRDGVAGARSLLNAAGEAAGAVGRDRAVLAALLATQAGDRPEADRQLAQVEDPERWHDRQNGALEALAVQAARVRLTVDLNAEMKLGQILDRQPDGATLVAALQQFLTPADVVLFVVAQRIGVTLHLESYVASMRVPTLPSDLQDFAHEVAIARRASLVEPSSFVPVLEPDVAAPKDSDGPWGASDLELDAAAKDMFKGPLADGMTLGLDLAILGWRRWRLATTRLFLAQACEQASQTDKATDWLSLSIAGTLAAFPGERQGGLGLRYVDQSLDSLLGKTLNTAQRAITHPLTVDRVSFAAQLLRHLASRDPDYGAVADWLEDAEKKAPKSSNVFIPLEVLGKLSPEQWGLGLYLLGPEPLDMLVRRIVGLPDSPVL